MRTSDTSLRPSLSVCVILSSSNDASLTLNPPDTSAVRCTNIIEPERRARRSRMPRRAGDDALLADADAETRGSSIRFSVCRVFFGTPASVRSPHAPSRRPMPCRRITTETSKPKGVFQRIKPRGKNGDTRHTPPMGSKGSFGNHQEPKIAKNATRLEYASLRWWMAFASRTELFSSSATFLVSLYSHSLMMILIAANHAALGSTDCTWSCAWCA